MPIHERYEHGTPSWIDISTIDVGGSKAFYAGLFGWSWQDLIDADGCFVYSIGSKDGRVVCGLNPVSPDRTDTGVSAVLNTYLAVRSVDAVYAAALEAGAKGLVEPFDMMDAGRVAFIADDQGARVGLWQAGVLKGAELVNEPGVYTWAELLTPDTGKAVNFYATIVGMGTEARNTVETNYTTFTVEGRVVGGVMPSPSQEVPPHWRVYFGVP